MDRVGEIEVPVTMHVLSPDWWVRSHSGRPSGYSDTFVTYDAGATWTSLRSGFTAPAFKDSTFWVLGAGVDGALLARWTSRGTQCLDGCLPTSPGQAGQTLLLRFNPTDKTWAVIDQLPAWQPDGTGAQPALKMTTSQRSSWLFGDLPPIFRFDGVGSWAEVSLPPGQSGSVAAAPDGTLYLFNAHAVATGVASASLWQLPSGAGAWAEIPSPPIAFERLVIDERQRVYGIGPRGFFRREAGRETWDDKTPPLDPGAGFTVAWTGQASRAGTVVMTARVSMTVSTTTTWYVRVFLSPDGGDTWTEHSAGLEKAQIYDIAFDPDQRAYVYVRISNPTGSWIWRAPTPDGW